MARKKRGFGASDEAHVRKAERALDSFTEQVDRALIKTSCLDVGKAIDQAWRAYGQYESHEASLLPRSEGEQERVKWAQELSHKLLSRDEQFEAKCVRRGKLSSSYPAPMSDYGVRTSPSRFYPPTEVMVRNNITGEITRRKRYTYESTNALYDVDVDINSGEISFKKNNRPSEKEPHHTEIARHFNIPVGPGGYEPEDALEGYGELDDYGTADSCTVYVPDGAIGIRWAVEGRVVGRTWGRPLEHGGFIGHARKVSCQATTVEYRSMTGEWVDISDQLKR